MTETNNSTMINTLYSNDFIKSHIGKLSAAEEKALLAEAQNGSSQAYDVLIKCFEPFIFDVAKDYMNRGVLEEDLLQETRIGLYEAIGCFDLTRDCRLSTWAYWYARKNISNALREQSSTVCVSSRDWRHKEKSTMVYYDTDDKFCSKFEDEHENSLMDLVEQSMWVLTDRERAVVRMLTPTDKENKMTLKEVGQELGVSLQYVAQIYNKAIKKLKVQAHRYLECA